MSARIPFARRPANSGPQANHRSQEELAVAEDRAAWLARTRVFLTPLAPPSIMGLVGFTLATLMVGAWQAGWFGTGATAMVLWPFAIVAGGLLQSIAAIASLRARDGVATAVHTTWGSFWIGWGILYLLVATHVVPAIPLGSTSPGLGMWFVVLTLVTAMCAAASLAQSVGLFTVLSSLTTGAALTASGFFAGNLAAVQAGGYLFVVSASAALLVAGAMVLENAFGRTIIPLGKWSKAANIPGRSATLPLTYPEGMPGVRVGQ